MIDVGDIVHGILEELVDQDGIIVQIHQVEAVEVLKQAGATRIKVL